MIDGKVAVKFTVVACLSTGWKMKSHEDLGSTTKMDGKPID